MSYAAIYEPLNTAIAAHERPESYFEPDPEPEPAHECGTCEGAIYDGDSCYYNYRTEEYFCEDCVGPMTAESGR